MSDGGGARGTALFVLAHHDDEVFCAGHLLQALRSGRRVRLLWATAGGLAPAARRRLEGERVCRLLGLAAGDCLDLRLPDQRALRHVTTIAAAAEQILGPGGAATDPPRTGDRETGGAAPGGWASGGSPGDGSAPRGSASGGSPTPGATAPAVYVPAYEGGHPDHDAVNLAVALLRTRRPETEAREFPLYRRGRTGLAVQSPWPAAGTLRQPFEVLALDAAALLLRRRLVRANASQALPSLLPLLVLAWGQGRGRAEPARLLPAHDYARPPHDGALLYELYTRWRFAGFRAAALAALADASATGPTSAAAEPGDARPAPSRTNP